MRRTSELVIPGVRSEAFGERDNGKTFILHEMDAYRGQDWALRAILALAASGVQMPQNVMEGGWAGLAAFGVTALLGAPYPALKPLLDEMLAQAKYQHKPNAPLQAIEPGVNCVVEEIKTFMLIQRALFTLHTGFSMAGDTSISATSPGQPVNEKP
jgi:hypothetical protein